MVYLNVHKYVQASLKTRNSALLYFLLFLNNLPLSLQYCASDFYADDATFHTHDKDIHTIESRKQSNINGSKLWSTSNKMHFHYQKTFCMTIGTRQRLDDTHHLDSKADNIITRSVPNQKLLDFILITFKLEYPYRQSSYGCLLQNITAAIAS